MKRLGYRAGLVWLAMNDDCEWLKDPEPIPSVTVLFLADMFGVDDHKAIADLRRVVAEERKGTT